MTICFFLKTFNTTRVATGVVLLLVICGTIPSQAKADGVFRIMLEEPVAGEVHGGVGNLRGWAVATDGIDKIEIMIDGVYAFDAPYGGARVDVGGAFPEVANASLSGFSLAYAYSNLSPGSHTISAVAHTRKGETQTSAATFETVRFKESFISGANAVNLEATSCTVSDDEIAASNALIGGDAYDILLDWRTEEQGFEIIKIIDNNQGDNPSNRYFDPKHIDLVIPESLWESAPQSSLEHAIPVDFDNDGLMDLLLEQAVGWYGPGGNVPNDNPDLYAPSNVIRLAFKQVEEAAYQLATQSVFGKDIVEMGDLSRKVMTADVNSDGFADVLMCLTREDGREMSYDEGYLNWSSRQKVVLSNGDGTYRVDDLGGDPQYQHGCTTAKMQDGSQHIVYGHNGSYSSATVYEYQAGQPVSVTGYPYLGGWDERALTPESASANSYSKYLMSNLTLGSEKGVKIFEQVDSQWLEYGTYVFGENRGAVDFIMQYNDGVQQQDMFWYDGHLRLSFTVSDSCEIRLSDEESVFVIKLDSMIVPESYVEPIDMDALEFDQIYTALAIRNGAIEELSLFDEEKSHPMGYSFLCGDMTADGYGDLSSIQLHNGLPVSFYKNDGNGDLVRVDVKGLEAVETLLPLASLPWPERVWFEDINGDGIGDWLQASKGIMRINFGVKPQ